MQAPVNWSREARRILKAEIALKDIGFKELSRALEAEGVHVDAKVFATKISRGTFSIAFFLQCMRALEIDTIRIKP